MVLLLKNLNFEVLSAYLKSSTSLTNLLKKDYSNFACRKPKLHRLVNIICTKLAALPSSKISGSFIGMRSLIKLCSSAEKAGEYCLFGHFLQLFRNRASNSLRIAEKALNSEKVLHSLSLVAHRYNLCYFIFQGWN